MDEWQFEQAQRREQAERDAGIAAAREKAKRRFVPLMFEDVPHCPDCLDPLPAHRIEAGICVPCLTDIEKRER